MFAETAIVDYRLSLANQGKQIPFSVSVFSKQTEGCRFHFPFATTFFVSSVFRSWNSGSMEMETWRMKT
jgi:hypothetical protein